MHYSWTASPVGSFAALSMKLQLAITSGNNAAAHGISLDIFRWGGVARKSTDPSRVWADNALATCSFVRKLKVAKRVLQPSRTIGLSVFRRDGLRMNAAMTKVYAASDPQNIIIYDGRVGAALCLLVREYLTTKKLTHVPADLAFLWGPPQRGPAEMRNPSTTHYVFKSLNQYGVSDQQRAEAARRANRVLSSMMARLKVIKVSVALADIEKALFMIGYDVRC